MRAFKAFFASLSITLGSALAAESATIRIPLVANTAPIQDPTQPTRWFTEVRIWNRNPVAVTARISDVIGSGNPSRSEFTVPAGGVLDLNGYDFFDATTPNAARIISALVELTSPLPLDVWTTINVDLRNGEGCVGSLGPPPPFVYMSGTCRPTGGPIMRGFRDYFAPDVPVALGWLTADPGVHRNKLYLLNPNTADLTVVASFRSTDGDVTITKSYSVPPRSLEVVTSLFGYDDPDFQPLVQANFKDPGSPQAATTAILRGNRAFYAFAAVLDDVDPHLGPAGVRFAIVQPDPAP